MKVLFLVPYLFVPGIRAFEKNATGFGYMVAKIAESVSKTGIRVDVLTTSAITLGGAYNGIRLLPRTWLKLFIHFKFHYIPKLISTIIQYQPSLQRMIRLCFYYLSAGYVEFILKDNDYDIVHIHGVGFAVKPYFEVCKRLSVPYIVTLHGLNSFSGSIRMDAGEKRFEKAFLNCAYREKIPLTVISSGVLNQILAYLNIQSGVADVHVIPNGTTLGGSEPEIGDIREKYSIEKHRSIMLCVGNISRNKNQLQVVMGYNAMPERYRSSLCIFFLGRDQTDGAVQRKITELGFEKNLILCGPIAKKNVDAFYRQADYTVVASISEGFGLSIIEGFIHGLPCLAFADLDAIEDVFDEKAMHTITVRSNLALAGGMIHMLSTQWDRTYIQQYARNFSLGTMAERYVAVYRKYGSKNDKQ